MVGQHARPGRARAFGPCRPEPPGHGLSRHDRAGVRASNNRLRNMRPMRDRTPKSHGNRNKKKSVQSDNDDPDIARVGLPSFAYTVPAFITKPTFFINAIFSSGLPG